MFKRFFVGLLSVGSALTLATTAALAQPQYDVAHVLQVAPRMVTIQQQQCQQVIVQGQDNSTAGAVLGGVAGGILGHQVGRGEGRTAATALGAVVGAMAGSNVGGRDAGYQPRTVCNMVPVTVQQGEVVTFEYKGRQFVQVVPN